MWIGNLHLGTFEINKPVRESVIIFKLPVTIWPAEISSVHVEIEWYLHVFSSYLSHIFNQSFFTIIERYWIASVENNSFRSFSSFFCWPFQGGSIAAGVWHLLCHCLFCRCPSFSTPGRLYCEAFSRYLHLYYAICRQRRRNKQKHTRSLTRGIAIWLPVGRYARPLSRL